MPNRWKDLRAPTRDDSQATLAKARRQVENSSAVLSLASQQQQQQQQRDIQAQRSVSPTVNRDVAMSPVTRPSAYRQGGPASAMVGHGYGSLGPTNISSPSRTAIFGRFSSSASPSSQHHRTLSNPNAATPSSPSPGAGFPLAADWRSKAQAQVPSTPSASRLTSHALEHRPAALAGAAPETFVRTFSAHQSPQVATGANSDSAGGFSPSRSLQSFSTTASLQASPQRPHLLPVPQPSQATPTILEATRADGVYADGTTARHRPLLPETIRDAMHMYLESTGRHDVVVAMLRAEKENTGGARVPSAEVNFSKAPWAAGEGVSPAGPKVPAAALPTAAAAGSPIARGASDLLVGGKPPLAPGMTREASMLMPNFPATVAVGSNDGSGGEPSLSRAQSFTASEDMSPLARSSPRATASSHAQPPATPAKSPSFSSAFANSVGPAARRRRSLAKKSHEILKRGLLERSAVERARTPADIVRGAASSGLLSSYVLPALYDAQQAVRADLVLLYAGIEEKLLLQYAQLGLPQPPLDALRCLIPQVERPMWCAADEVDAAVLPRPSNRVTGRVLYGTVNQLVEQLTQVYIFPVASTPERLVAADQYFQEVFFRKYRMFLPSSVLLAKLIERFFVPYSLRFHAEHYCAHGITVHAPGNGSSIPLKRSQGETVYREGARRYPGYYTTESWAVGGEGHSFNGESALPKHASTSAGGPGPANLSRTCTVSDFSNVPSHNMADEVAVPLFRDPTELSSSAFADGTRRPAGTTGGERSVGSFAGDVAGLPSAGGEGDFSARPDITVKLVTHYSKSGSLWLMICESVQTKVLTVILQWLTTHPSHFDEETIHCLLHFVEVCCYQPTNFADCPSKFPQIAEFIRMNCFHALQRLQKQRVLRNRTTAEATASAAAFAAPHPGIGLTPFRIVGGLPAAAAGTSARSQTRIPSSLCSFALDERRKAFEETVPPTLRKSQTYVRTWRNVVESKEMKSMLPYFASPKPHTAEEERGRATLRAYLGNGGRKQFTKLPSASLPSALGAVNSSKRVDPPRTQLARGQDPNPGLSSHSPQPEWSGAAGQQATAGAEQSADNTATPLDARTAALHASQHVLQLFSRVSLEVYVKGLTAAHQILFSLFPSLDLLVASLHDSVSFQTSPVFQQSYLGIFLRTSKEMTQWATSLLLHAALLDGERRADVMRAAGAFFDAMGSANRAPSVTSHGPPGNASVLSTGLGDVPPGVRDYITGDADHEGTTGQGSRPSSVSFPHSHSSNSRSSSGSDTDSDGESPSPSFAQEVAGNVSGRFSFNTATGLSDAVGRGLDGSMHEEPAGFARMQRSLGHLPANARRYSIAPAKCFLDTLNRVADLVVGFLRVNNLHASYSVFRALRHPFVQKILKNPFIVANMDTHTSHQLRQLKRLFARPEHMARRAGAPHSPSLFTADGFTSEEAGAGGAYSPMGEGYAREKSHQDLTMGEYMKALSDNAEFPTIPAVQYHMRELQRIHATEPTFLTKRMDDLYPSSQEERQRRSAGLPEPRSAASSNSPAVPEDGQPNVVCLVHWRKFLMEDEVVQTVSGLQTAALYHIASRATVVRFAAVDEELEKSFVEQLHFAVVEDAWLQREMANRLLSTLV